MVRKTFAILVTICLMVVLLAGCGGKKAATEVKYPTKPITILVPYAAGGACDMMVRIMEPSLAKKMGQPIVVVNKPGGSGSVAMLEALKSKPDGYTLVAATSGPGSITPHVTNVGYTNKDFQPISIILDLPLGIGVPADSPFKTVNDFFEYAKKNPNQLRVSTPGPTQTQHITMQQMAEERGVKINLVPFNGGAEALTAILGKNVDATSTAVTEMASHAKAGKLRILGITAEKRAFVVPDVPTFKEQGINLQRGIWYGIVAPKGTPDAIVKKWETAIKQTLDEPEIKKAFENSNLIMSFVGSEDFKNKWQEEFDRNAKSLKKQ